MTPDLLYEDKDFVAFRDIHPQAPIHVLIVPRNHIPTLLDVKDEEFDLIGGAFRVVKEIAEKEGISNDGFRVVLNCKGLGGQEVFHLHFHLLGGRQMRWPPG
jgi:histidine triad (HIT) family protein